MNTKEAALEVMETLRRRWVEELSSAVLANADGLKAVSPSAGPPFACDARLAALAHQIAELQSLIDAFDDDVDGNRRRAGENPPGEHATEDDAIFSQFLAFVATDRLDDAARELGCFIPLSPARLATSTEFFARAARAKPGLASQLNGLCRRLDTIRDTEVAQILIQTLGFQALEAQFAIESLRRHRPSPSRSK